MENKKTDKPYYFINSFDSNTWWYKGILVVAILMFGALCYVGYEFVKVTFFIK